VHEVIRAPRIVRIFAGIDFVMMFGFAMLGVFISGLSSLFNEILNYAHANDPSLYVEIINEIINVGLVQETLGHHFRSGCVRFRYHWRNS
jgi:hypothetical protein